MQKLKLYFLYYRSLLSVSLPLSVLAGLMSMALGTDKLVGFINGFSLALLTGSFILSLYFYEQRYQNQYYFYHNLGISKAGLILCSCLFNVAFALLLLILKIYLYA